MNVTVVVYLLIFAVVHSLLGYSRPWWADVALGSLLCLLLSAAYEGGRRSALDPIPPRATAEDVRK